ncbi:protein of unknown function [Candidatus Methylomirabilis oxygeniifera]|uniref:Uncharacterized protein n=1 Tax=Methylomirabilis oxygeniifera TaxID=671143 RepID=D5MEY9_METO1|nr:protein of unknown function [Candidatus Methylomirabilis oxyfera]
MPQGSTLSKHLHTYVICKQKSNSLRGRQRGSAIERRSIIARTVSNDSEGGYPLQTGGCFLLCNLEDLIVRANTLADFDSDQLARLRLLERQMFELDRIYSLCEFGRMALDVDGVTYQQMALGHLNCSHPYLGEILFDITDLHLRHGIPPCPSTASSRPFPPSLPR